MKSDRFIFLKSQFERQNGEMGDGDGRLPDVYSKQHSQKLSFWGEGGENKKPRKVCVIRRGGGGNDEREILLARPSANEKRAGDTHDLEAWLPGITAKRLRCSN